MAEERLRFSRDLHDLLGHTLSVMVVKAEAVRRLAPRGPGGGGRARRPTSRPIGRQALTEVREAVTGYRGASLAAELARRAPALADAGIAAVGRAPATPLPPEADACSAGPCARG